MTLSTRSCTCIDLSSRREAPKRPTCDLYSSLVFSSCASDSFRVSREAADCSISSAILCLVLRRLAVMSSAAFAFSASVSSFAATWREPAPERSAVRSSRAAFAACRLASACAAWNSCCSLSCSRLYTFSRSITRCISSGVSCSSANNSKSRSCCRIPEKLSFTRELAFESHIVPSVPSDFPESFAPSTRLSNSLRTRAASSTKLDSIILSSSSILVET
mmetsp:Transcript_35312/g.83767  ORF Transcript_35312/g.83767 Transcript_35312/m.83767 type:complete len:219 (-) Transcript_35312:241-897(-)